jgi:hypothetical protein
LQLAQVTTANSTPGQRRMELGAQRMDVAPGLFHDTVATLGLLAARDNMQQSR